MKRICPNPRSWYQTFKRLVEYTKSHPCNPTDPPIPLILAGWASSDVEKIERWEETVAWAEKNGCSNLVTGIPDEDFYFVEKPTRTWDLVAKIRPSSEQIAHTLTLLRSHWSDIVGHEIGRITRPLAFTGTKARRLLVLAEASAAPPWGGWSYLTKNEAKRKTFTEFRAAINKAIAPHEIDHIDFTIEENAEQSR